MARPYIALNQTHSFDSLNLLFSNTLLMLNLLHRFHSLIFYYKCVGKKWYCRFFVYNGDQNEGLSLPKACGLIKSLRKPELV